MNTFRPLFYLALVSLFLSCNMEEKADPGLYINEFLCSNSAFGADSINFAHSDWVEIYNAYDHAVDLGGYFLSDDADEIEKWAIPSGNNIPPNGYLIIWADGLDTLLHSNFRLSKAGGELILSSKEKVELDYVAYNLQALNVSMGRKWDGNEKWNYFDRPNPALSNNNYEGVENIAYSSPPRFSIEAGFYDSNLELEIDCSDPNTDIYYTINGDVPSRNGSRYKKKIHIDSTIVIRAACFTKGKLKSKTLTKTYFINVEKDLPIFSLVSDNEALWDDSTGIYQRSLRSVERMANVEYFEDKKGILNQEIDLSISGNWARHHAQKAMVLEAKSKYGKETLDHRFFPKKRTYKFQGILLRAGGHPDKYNTQFKDAYGGYITEDHVDIDHAGYKPAVLYLNGEYWGIYNIREKINNNFLIDNHRLDKDKFTFLQDSWLVERNGSKKDYEDTRNFIISCNKKDQENYRKIAELIDIDNYINYMIIEMYAANIDWPNWNLKFWKENEENGKWKWILIDLDFAFGSGAKPDFNMMEFVGSGIKTRETNPPHATKLFRSLLEFKAFKDEFIQRFAASLNEIYPSDRLTSILDTFRDERLNEMPYEIDRWHYFVYQSPWGKFRVRGSVEEWDTKIDQMREFIQLRPDYVRKNMKEFFDLAPLVAVKTHSEEGKLFINSIRVDSVEKTGMYFSDVEMKITAKPKAGYLLDHYLINGKSKKGPVLHHFPKDGDEITAVYKKVSTSILPCELSENKRLTKEESPYYITCDLIIHKGTELIIEDGVDLYMDTHTSIVVNGGLRILGKEDSQVNILPNPENASKEWGALVVDNAETNVELNHANLIRSTWHDDKLKFKASITCFNSNLSLDHVSVQSNDFPFYSEYGNISITNSSLTSPKTCDMINIKYAESALVEGCTLPGNYYPDTDAIDYDQIHNGIIRNNTIYGFFGFNSDAIDIGEASSDILIEGNVIYNMSDKGISIGQGSSAIIKNNLIYGCIMGVGIKDKNSFASISNCSFVANKYGVATFEKNENAGGGSAEIAYCIFNKSRKKSIFVDDKSTVSVRYSLSDEEAFEGIGNRVGDPAFKNTKLLNFEVDSSSLASNSGPTNTLDMGCKIAKVQEKTAQIRIEDIHFNFDDKENPYVHVQLLNESNFDVDLTYYTIKNDRFTSYPLPNGFVLKAGERVLITNDEKRYLPGNSNHLSVRNCIEKKLISKGNDLYLYDAQMNLVDEKKIIKALAKITPSN